MRSNDRNQAKIIKLREIVDNDEEKHYAFV